MNEIREALEDARHTLTTLHGLYAYDGAAPDETWQIDEHKTLAKLDAAILQLVKLVHDSVDMNDMVLAHPTDNWWDCPHELCRQARETNR